MVMTFRPAATLLEAEPALIQLLGVAATATLGHERILPVLTLAAGEWLPPERAVLGRETLALIVLDGWLLADNAERLMLGRGDRLDPWATQRRWTAAAPMRLAVLGEALTHALRNFPGAACKLCALRRPHHAPREDEPLERRLADLLWSLARHWGTLDGREIALPASIDASVLALFMGDGAGEIGRALAELRTRGRITRPRKGGWVLHADAGDRREQLQARVAEQLAVSRMTSADCAAVVADIHSRRV
jgi:hypothetical protein